MLRLSLVTALLFAYSFAVGACSLFGSENAEMRIGIGLSGPAGAEGLTLEGTVVEPGRTRTFRHGDFEAASLQRYEVGPFDMATSGAARVACTLSRDRASTTGEVVIRLREDWRHGVDCLVEEENPLFVCMGCAGSEAFVLDPALGFAPTDSLFVVWGGNSISNPVDY